MSEFRNSAFYKPSSVKLEFVRGCNRKCEFCATNGITADHAHMTMETLERAVTLINESGYNPRIQIDGRGEHTLHPNFYAMVKKIKEIIPTSCIQLISNGWLVQHSEHAIPKMLKAGINDITLDEYFDSHFDPEYVQKEIDLYTKKTGNKVDFFIMGPGVPMYGEKNPNKRRVVIVPDISAGQITVSRKLTNQCGAGMPPNDEYKDRVCTRVFREVPIRYDGNMVLCCQDFRDQFVIGNINDVDTFDELWRSDRFEAARRILYHDHRTFFPCNICNLMPIRPGLLPDHLGKEDMEVPTKKDYKMVDKKIETGLELRPRKWEEKSGITTAENLNLKKKRK